MGIVDEAWCRHCLGAGLTTGLGAGEGFAPVRSKSMRIASLEYLPLHSQSQALLADRRQL